MRRVEARQVTQTVVGRRVGGVVSAVALALMAAGCGGSHIGVPTGAAPTTGAGGPGYMVHAQKVGALGTVLTDGYDETLYLFVPDAGSGHSTCTGPCAAKWPPLTLPSGVTTPFVGAGVRGSLVGTTRRAGGDLQVTYAGWPLYHWVGDTEPGQATGEGIRDSGGLWYAVDVAGQAVH
jgi:predicted lipoprotein with Yx(FWY)xxD motif